mgnify:CR=1 FL=1
MDEEELKPDQRQHIRNDTRMNPCRESFKENDFSNHLEAMASKWPSAWVARTKITQFTGGLIGEKYLANLDSQGLGPEGRFRIGRKIAYPVPCILKWLQGRYGAIQK